MHSLLYDLLFDKSTTNRSIVKYAGPVEQWNMSIEPKASMEPYPPPP